MRRRVYDWNEKDYPEFYNRTMEQVEAMGGKFYNTSGVWVVPNETNTGWFVPTSNTQPVMTKKRNGLWSARGF